MKDCSKGYENKLVSLSLLKDTPRQMRVKASGNTQLIQLRFPDMSTVSIPYSRHKHHIYHFGLAPSYKPRIFVQSGLVFLLLALHRSRCSLGHGQKPNRSSSRRWLLFQVNAQKMHAIMTFLGKGSLHPHRLPHFMLNSHCASL